MEASGMNYAHFNPAFAVHYNQGGYQLNAAMKRAFMDSETLIHGEIQMQREFQRRRSLTATEALFTPISHHEIFAPIQKMVARILEEGGWEAYSRRRQSQIERLPTHPVERHLHWMRLAQQDECRANNHFLQSALGFEPTDSSTIDGVELFHDMAPFTVQPKPQVCTDFGFEPTEGCE